MSEETKGPTDFELKLGFLWIWILYFTVGVSVILHDGASWVLLGALAFLTLVMGHIMGISRLPSLGSSELQPIRPFRRRY